MDILITAIPNWVMAIAAVLSALIALFTIPKAVADYSATQRQFELIQQLVSNSKVKAKNRKVLTDALNMKAAKLAAAEMVVEPSIWYQAVAWVLSLLVAVGYFFFFQNLFSGVGTLAASIFAVFASAIVALLFSILMFWLGLQRAQKKWLKKHCASGGLTAPSGSEPA